MQCVSVLCGVDFPSIMFDGGGRVVLNGLLVSQISLFEVNNSHLLETKS